MVVDRYKETYAALDVETDVNRIIANRAVSA